MWWAKARRAHSVLPAALALFIVLLAVVGDGTVVLPSLMGGSGHVMLMLFIPVPLVAGLQWCLESRLAAPELSGVRPVHLFDAGLCLALVAATLALSVVVGAFVGSWEPVTAGRNTLFLIGVMLVARPLLGTPAVLAPVAWLMAVALVGFRPGNDPYPWTVLPEPLSAPHAAAGAVLTFTLGLAVQIRSSRNLS